MGRARAHLEMLVADVGESAGISIAAGDRSVLYLDQVDGDQDVTLRDWTGEQLPLHVVSSGMVLLADAIRRRGARVRTRWTGPVHRAHRRTRVPSSGAGSARRGPTVHAWTVEEYSVGITSVAAPIRDGDGTVVGALHVHGPSYRLRPDDRAVARLLVAAAARFEPAQGRRSLRSKTTTPTIVATAATVSMVRTPGDHVGPTGPCPSACANEDAPCHGRTPSSS